MDNLYLVQVEGYPESIVCMGEEALNEVLDSYPHHATQLFELTGITAVPFVREPAGA